MRPSLLLFSLAAILALALPAEARIKRSQSAKVAFKAEHPCPATGARKGPCKGYVIDHVVPLCAGGPDRPENMQWQTIAEGKAKDRLEVRQCRSSGSSRLAPRP